MSQSSEVPPPDDLGRAYLLLRLLCEDATIGEDLRDAYGEELTTTAGDRFLKARGWSARRTRGKEHRGSDQVDLGLDRRCDALRGQRADEWLSSFSAKCG